MVNVTSVLGSTMVVALSGIALSKGVNYDYLRGALGDIVHRICRMRK